MGSNPPKSASSPLPLGPPPPYSSPMYPNPPPPQDRDSSDSDSHSSAIYTATSRSRQDIRSRFFSGLKQLGAPPRGSKFKSISTAPGQLCAGETETEADEPSRRLPTARIVPASAPIIPPNTLQQRLTPLLFELSRLLAVVPALVGTLYNLYRLYSPPTSSPFPARKPPERIDYLVSALWAILTGYQCLALTTGLLTRWRLYYPPLSTLIRLLALQGICWPATQLTLSIFEHEKRPVVVWALIGTTTCMSRSVQIWVTSNLWWDGPPGAEEEVASTTAPASAPVASARHEGEISAIKDDMAHVRARRGYWRRWGGKWGGRRWDWKEVGSKCLLPASLMYFIMAWAEQLRRENFFYH
ncbi:hypothetical protein APHAL10511_004963 [Amanita phalloides]|nr:hypothetical protein APHAL10511_004963 [Amanita phalloides]